MFHDYLHSKELRVRARCAQISDIAILIELWSDQDKKSTWVEIDLKTGATLQ